MAVSRFASMYLITALGTGAIAVFGSGAFNPMDAIGEAMVSIAPSAAAEGASPARSGKNVVDSSSVTGSGQGGQPDWEGVSFNDLLAEAMVEADVRFEGEDPPQEQLHHHLPATDQREPAGPTTG